ncbi:glycosyltransferase [Ideonella paludis]|uniref:glycosyltransferase n=1 Tax=Ideonella paludis TaxID=1233411 RepID=UPI00362E049E
MKVLHIITGLDTGGAELMLYRLTQELPGVQHFVISLTSMGSVADRLAKAGISVRALNLSPVNLVRSFFRLYSSCRAINPDVVQTWMVHSDLLGGLAVRLAGVRSLVWGVRTTDYSVESHSTRLVRWLCARLSRVLPARIVCAAHASLLNSQAAGYAAAKLMVIPNGFDVARLSESLGAGEPMRQTLGLNRDACVVGCLGRYNPAKDHANFVTAAGLLADRFPMYGS